jgi:ParB/RepB/Spo0J family partition protein
MTNYQELEIDAVHPSPFQPRKSFDERKLQELAASIGPAEPRDGKPAGPGVLSPIVVRKNNKGHEIIFGERRWRASKLVGRTKIPSLVVEMSDAEVMEAQLIENSQREDVNALEEANHYDLLIKKHKHTIETIAAKTGKSRSHVYARIGLLKLGPIAKKALADGRLAAAIATDLVVTIEDAKLQEQYVRECLGENLNYRETSALEDLGIAHEAVSDVDETGEPGYVDHNADAKPLSYRAARELLRRKYSTKLSLAKFDPTDATLTKAGACGPCPHRSGSQPELPGMAPSKTADDVCTKPSCFEEKTQAVWKIQTKGAEARGLKVVEREDAKNVFFDSGEIKPTSPYVDPEDSPPPNIAKPGPTASWGKLLGKKLAEIPRVLVQDVTGAPRELLDRKKAVEVLREAGKLDEPEKPKKSTSSSSSSSPSVNSEQYRKEQEKRERENEQKEQALKAVLVVASAAGEELSDKKELAFWRLVGRWAVQDRHWDLDVVADRHELAQSKHLLDLIDKAKGVGAIRGLLAECIVATTHDHPYSKDDKETFDDACKLLGVDYDKTLEAVKAADKEKAKLEAAAAKAEEKKDAKADKPAKAAKAAKTKSPAKKKGGKK